MRIHQAVSHRCIRHNTLSMIPKSIFTTIHNVKMSHFNFYLTYLTWLQCVYIFKTMKYFDSQMAPISFQCINNYSSKSKIPWFPHLILLFPSNFIEVQKTNTNENFTISRICIIGDFVMCLGIVVKNTK